MSRRPPQPQPPHAIEQLDALAPAALAEETTYAEVELTDLDLADQRARGVALESVVLRRVDLSGSRLEGLRLLDATLTGCNLANLQARGAELNRVRVESSRLTGTVLLESQLRDVTFRGCRIDLASFSHCRLNRVTFDNCILHQSDFLGAELDTVRFEDCELVEADLRNARLRRCELRRTSLDGLQGVDRLRGIAMPWAEIVERADLWASALGIEVLDEEP